MFEELKDIIQGRRSVRNYTEQNVSNEDIQEIIDCARYAPSDTNSQTWHFLAIKNKEKIKAIEQLTWEGIEEKAKAAEEKGLVKEAKLLRKSFGPYATAFSNAPVLIICLATPYDSKFRQRIFDPIDIIPEEIWKEEGIKSSTLAAQNLMLAAYAKGLGTCPMTGPVLLAGEQLRKYLELDDNLALNMVIALGYPAESPKKLPRKEIKDILDIIE